MKNIYEIFDEISRTKASADRINILRFNNSWALKNVLIGIFHPNVKFVVKEIPPYKKGDIPPGMGYSSINQELRMMYLFEEGNPSCPPGLTDKRRTEILLQMLESLEPREAEVLENMLLKKHKVKGLSYALVKSAFPDLLP